VVELKMELEPYAPDREATMSTRLPGASATSSGGFVQWTWSPSTNIRR
jgi:hypothetical protein